MLNSRFHNLNATLLRHTSSARHELLAAAGVVVHTLDGSDTADPTPARATDYGYASRGGDGTPMNRPSSAQPIKHDWRMRPFSASIMGHALPYVFRGNTRWQPKLANTGFVLSPKAAGAALRCSYASDGWTTSIKCGQHDRGCIPGCTGGWAMPNGSVRGRVPYCTHGDSSVWSPWRASGALGQGEQSTSPRSRRCSWRPTDLWSMLSQHARRMRPLTRSCGRSNSSSCCSRDCCAWPDCLWYNELIFDPAALQHYWPHAIEAVVSYAPASMTEARKSVRHGTARHVHGQLRDAILAWHRESSLSTRTTAHVHVPPLVSVDISQAAYKAAPFTLVSTVTPDSPQA